MKPLLLSAALICACGTAQAEGLDFSGTVSMGLQSTSSGGTTTVEPYARVNGTVSYTIETDFGATFVLAFEFDQALLDAAPTPFLPGHR